MDVTQYLEEQILRPEGYPDDYFSPNKCRHPSCRGRLMKAGDFVVIKGESVQYAQIRSFYKLENDTFACLIPYSIIGTDLVSSSDFIDPLKKQIEDNEAKISQQKTPIVLGKVEINGKKHFGYIIPIYFAEEWLGYFTVFTKNKLHKIFIDFLDNFEDDYIDDQLIHILRNSKK